MANTIALADLCKTLKINGKVARRRLRASGEVKKSKEGWVFTAAQKKKVVAIVKGEA